jgi:hypothetical protein
MSCAATKTNQVTARKQNRSQPLLLALATAITRYSSQHRHKLAYTTPSHFAPAALSADDHTTVRHINNRWRHFETSTPPCLAC